MKIKNVKDYFKTKKECEDYIKHYEFPAPYYLAHGECDGPEITARQYKDGWACHIQRHYTDGACHQGWSGRVSMAHLIDNYVGYIGVETIDYHAHEDGDYFPAHHKYAHNR